MSDTSLSTNGKIQLAQSFTELAIQNGMIHKQASNEDTAKEIAQFYETIVKNLE